MTEEEKTSINYRFSGYQPPLITLDETGPAYFYKFWIHPYFINQPSYWKMGSFGYNINSYDYVEPSGTGGSSSGGTATEIKINTLVPICKNNV